MECWKQLVDLPYEVSDHGRVRNRWGRILKCDGGKNRYPRLMYKDKHYAVHRLVVTAFIGAIPEGMEVDHINGIKCDNRLENLEIVSGAENIFRYCKKVYGENFFHKQRITPVGKRGPLKRTYVCHRSNGDKLYFKGCAELKAAGFNHTSVSTAATRGTKYKKMFWSKHYDEIVYVKREIT